MFKENFIKLCAIGNESPSSVCQKIGITPSAFSQWNENSIPRKVTLQKIADYFGVSVVDLIGTPNTPSATPAGSSSFSLPANVQTIQLRQFPKLGKIPSTPKQAPQSSRQLTPEEQGRIVGNLRGDLTVSEFAQKCGIAETVLEKLESGFDFDADGRAEEKKEALTNVAKATGFPLPKLTHRVTLTEAGLSHSFPVYEAPAFSCRVACAPMPFADEAQYDSFVHAPADIQADFCLTALDDSMRGARIQKNDLVFIRAQDTVQNGQIAAVILNDEAILRRWFYYPETAKLILSADHSACEPLVFVGSEVDSVRCLGLAVAFMSNL